MKKALMLIIPAVLVLTACKGNTENVQVGSVTTAYVEQVAGTAEVSSEAPTAEEDPDFLEEEYMEGIVEILDGDFITIRTDDGKTGVFDISGAENESDEELLQFCQAEVSYNGTPGNTPLKAGYVLVTMSLEQVAENYDKDPVICGTLVLDDVNELVINDSNGKEKIFDNSISRVVSLGSGLKEGTKVYVTYTGSLENMDVDADPIAIKIVTEDAIDTEEADAQYLEGVVGRIDGDILTVDTEALSVEFICSDEMLKGIEDGNHVKAYYDGTIRDRRVDAEKVEVLN